MPFAGLIHGAPLGLAAAYGALTMLAFSLWPLGRAARTRPGVLFRGAAAPASGWPPLAAIAGTVLAAAALAGIAVATAPRPSIALGFVLGAPAALAIFRAAAALVVILARRIRPRRLPALRLGLANLGRPGAPTVPVAMSLGTGLAVLVAIALVEGNLAAQISEQREDERPAFFFLDIQKHQIAPFERLVEETAGADYGRRVPMLRGRVVRIDGVPVREAAVAPGSEWVVQSDIGLSYAADPPPNAEITAGPMVGRRLQRAAAGLADRRGGARFRPRTRRHPLHQRAGARVHGRGRKLSPGRLDGLRYKLRRDILPRSPGGSAADAARHRARDTGGGTRA